MERHKAGEGMGSVRVVSVGLAKVTLGHGTDTSRKIIN